MTATAPPAPHRDALQPPPRLTEAQLTALWRGRRFPDAALVTRAGVPVRVISQGRAGRGPGPDFRGAAIAGPSGAAVRGDIELHVRASDFRAHRHDRDAAYARVILHLVFEDDTGADTPLYGGGAAPVVALAPWVARRADELRHWLERPLLWREPCHGAVMRLGAEGAAAALEAEGDRRLAARTAEVAEHVAEAGIEQALYERLLAALGSGGNGPPMRALARLLPWEDLRTRTAAGDPTDMKALLLGSAGLLPSQRGHGGAAEPHVAALERAFAQAGLPALAAADWKLWGVRPANAPARRLAAAAALLSSLGAPSALLQIIDAPTPAQAIAPLASLTALPYWRAHYDPCAGADRPRPRDRDPRQRRAARGDRVRRCGADGPRAGAVTGAAAGRLRRHAVHRNGAGLEGREGVWGKHRPCARPRPRADQRAARAGAAGAAPRLVRAQRLRPVSVIVAVSVQLSALSRMLHVQCG